MNIEKTIKIGCFILLFIFLGLLCWQQYFKIREKIQENQAKIQEKKCIELCFEWRKRNTEFRYRYQFNDFPAEFKKWCSDFCGASNAEYWVQTFENLLQASSTLSK